LSRHHDPSVMGPILLSLTHPEAERQYIFARMDADIPLLSAFHPRSSVMKCSFQALPALILRACEMLGCFSNSRAVLRFLRECGVFCYRACMRERSGATRIEELRPHSLWICAVRSCTLAWYAVKRGIDRDASPRQQSFGLPIKTK